MRDGFGNATRPRASSITGEAVKTRFARDSLSKYADGFHTARRSVVHFGVGLGGARMQAKLLELFAQSEAG